jgi:hypothetical protein
LKLLSFAEGFLTNGSTPGKLAAAAVLLAGTAYLATPETTWGFTDWAIAGFFGAPAVVLFGAAAVIYAITSGTYQSKDINVTDTKVEYDLKSGAFKNQKINEPVTLLDVLERRKLLSFLEENRLLSLAGSLIDKPLTLTENLGVLSTLENTGLLSELESAASDDTAPLRSGIFGGVLLALGLGVGIAVNVLLGLLVALPGLVLVGYGIALGAFSVPKSYDKV